MQKLTYFAIFEKTNTGFSVYFPDLPGCITVGNTIESARTNAAEALGLHIWGMEKDVEILPPAILPPFEDMETDSFVMPIEIYLDLVKNDMENRAVKKTLTILYWLNEAAEKENVNFSHLLQTALKDYLSIHDKL